MEFSLRILCATSLVLHAYILSVATKESKIINQPSCESWHTVYQVLKSQPNNQISCIEEDFCTGLSCNGTYERYSYSVGFKLNGCDDPPTVEINCDIPELGLHKMKHTFQNGDRYKLPGVHLSSLNFDFYLEVAIIKQSQHILLTVILKPEISSVETYSLKTYPLLTNETINLPQCQKMAFQSTTTANHISSVNQQPVSLGVKNGKIEQGKDCSISKMGDCDENEICVQTSTLGPKGVCECLENFHRNENNACVSNNSTEGNHSKPNLAVILGTAIPLCLVLIFSACGFVVFKLGLVQKFREYRSPTRSYEVLDIGAENDDDDDVPMVV